MLPLRCLPLWGREGVTLLMAREHYGDFSKNRDFSPTKMGTPDSPMLVMDAADLGCGYPCDRLI
jgi:hypothetical protein